MNVDSIVKAILQGIYASNLEYEKWSRGGCWLNDTGSESQMVAGIARSLYERPHKKNEYTDLRLEWNVKQNNEIDSNSRERVDIAMLDKSGRTTCVVEAKIKWGNKTCENDMSRIVELVKNDNGVAFGILAVFIAQPGKIIERKFLKIEEKLDEVQQANPEIVIDHIKSNLWGYPVKWRYNHDYPNWEQWQNYKGRGLCITISRADN